MIPRRLRIVLWALCSIVIVWSGIATVVESLRNGGSIQDMLLDPSVPFVLIVGPICWGQLSRYLMAERQENVLNPDFTLTLREPWIARALLGLMAIGLLASGVAEFWGRFILAGRDMPIYQGILYCAAGMIVGLSAMLAPRAHLGLHPDNFDCSSVKSGGVPWQQVAEVSVRRVLLTSWLVVSLKNATEVRSTNWLRRWRKSNEVLLHPAFFGLETEVLKKGIENRRDVFAF